MEHTIARIRTKDRYQKFRKVLSDQRLYEQVEIDSVVVYDPDHKLDDGAWFVIEKFSEKEYCIDFLKNDFVSTSYEQLETKDIDKIDYLCYIPDQNTYYFQNVTKNNVLSKRVIAFGDVVKFHENRREIVIREQPDAVYFKQKDELCFRNLSSITSIFKGIDALYREATQEEAEEFLENDFLDAAEFSADKIKTANRKRIALIADTMKEMKDDQKKIILDSMKYYCPELVTDKGKFKVSTDNDLKMVLFGLHQRFYTTPDGNEQRIANSIITLRRKT